MELNFDKIIRLKKIEIDKAELSNEEKTLKQPVLTNMEFIPEIYETYKSTIGKDYASVQNRKKFIFVILYLYSPSTLSCNRKMPKGLRDKIANTIGIYSKSAISSNCSDVIFLYQNYADFRNDVSRIYKNIELP